MPKLWNGTRYQMSWVRMSGAKRQSAFSVLKPQPWECAGCGKGHGAKTERTIGLDGKNYCNRTFWLARESWLSERAASLTSQGGKTP